MEKLAALALVKSAVLGRAGTWAMQNLVRGPWNAGKYALGVGLPVGFGLWSFQGGRDKITNSPWAQGGVDAAMAAGWNQMGAGKRFLAAAFPEATAMSFDHKMKNMAKAPGAPGAPKAPASPAAPKSNYTTGAVT